MDDRDGNAAGAIFLVIGLVLLAFAPIIARLMQFAVSRRRESLADVSGVADDPLPAGLISALEKLRDDQTVVGSASRADRASLDRAAHGPHSRRGPALTHQPNVRHAPPTGRAHRCAQGALITCAPHSWRPLLVSLTAVGGLALAACSSGAGASSTPRAGPSSTSDSSTSTTVEPSTTTTVPAVLAPLTGLPDRSCEGVAPGARGEDRQLPDDRPPAGRDQPGRRRLRGDRRGHHAVRRGLPVRGRRPGRPHSFRAHERHQHPRSARPAAPGVVRRKPVRDPRRSATRTSTT